MTERRLTSPFEPQTHYWGFYSFIETWADVVGLEGAYKVSSFGRVASVDRKFLRRMGWKTKRNDLFVVKTVRGRILKARVNWKRPNKPYLQVHIGGKNRDVHTLVGEAFHGPRAPGELWRHLNDHSLDNHADNLEAGTQVENMADARRNGRLATGRRLPRTVLSDPNAAAIRALNGVISQSNLARRFGVQPSTVQCIHDGRTWKHLSEISLEQAISIFEGISTLSLPHIEFALTWDLVETQVASHGSAARIYYSNESTFWSHLRGHALANGPEMRCPLGTQIYAETDWQGWLEAARENPAFYGRHGLRALLAAHHSNVRDAASGGFYAAKKWGVFNDALDALDAETARLTSGEKPKRIDLTAPKTAAFANARRPRRG